ncbi:hypothetical protein EXIGLDRAFT_34996 [Exidia glandulosa HHB12029]|uniref:Uncharacterized protein n=1 Tax=Exidia glandulosa HHB12029 TaxID=1314781 RepID=A0A166ANQ6_EXIGL|nr:hypothetical protein EXIGLDRAFT_34996 [Exidia glandulosa HHB12029]
MIQDGIPTSVGPTGRFYSLSYRLYDSPLTSFDDALGYSNGWNDFTLLGTGNWTQYELEGHGMWDWNENVPCSAYDCARRCAQQLDAHSLPYGDPTMTACLKACPGYDDRQKGCITKDAFDGNTLQQTIIGTRPRYSPGSSSDAAASTSTTSAEASPSSTNPPNSSFRVELPLLECVGAILGALLAIG